MNQPTVEVAFRIPGLWSHPKELVDRLPVGFELQPDKLVMPDKTEIAFGAARADNQFAKIFRSSCRQQPTETELRTVDNYKVNVFLMGPAGSLTSAHTMMKAAAAIIHAGGAGVFIDNSGLAHGGEHWQSMTDDGSSDAISFAFVSIIRGKEDVWTMGMHVLGLRDIVMKRTDIEVEGFDIVDVIRYVARGDQPVGEGHFIADLSGPRFRATCIDSPPELTGSPMQNPFGRLKLVNMKGIAQNN